MNTYTVLRGDTLYGIAKKFDTSVQSIKELNNLTSDNLAVGQRLIIRSDGDSTPNECIVYTVKKGDNLYSIARKYGTSVDDIKRYNGLTDNLLDVGDRLVIPCEDGGSEYKPLENNYISYTVQKGDSLYSIAKKYNTTVDKIMDDNDLTSDDLDIGMTLVIDDKSGTSSVKECFGSGDFPDTVDKTQYVVVRGDNLYSIAKKFGVSLESIKKENNLTSDDLQIGDVLIIPTSSTTYKVQKGESLYSIAKKFNVTVDYLKDKNNLTGNLISVGQELII